MSSATRRLMNICAVYTNSLRLRRWKVFRNWKKRNNSFFLEIITEKRYNLKEICRFSVFLYSCKIFAISVVFFFKID